MKAIISSLSGMCSLVFFLKNIMEALSRDCRFFYSVSGDALINGLFLVKRRKKKLKFSWVYFCAHSQLGRHGTQRKESDFSACLTPCYFRLSERRCLLFLLLPPGDAFLFGFKLPVDGGDDFKLGLTVVVLVRFVFFCFNILLKKQFAIAKPTDGLMNCFYFK